MKQLGGLDASFLYMETPQTPMHVGGLYLFEPAPGRDADSFYDDFKAHLSRRLHLAPILAKTLSPMPLDMDHPVWVDAAEVDLDYHIRRIGLPRPGTMRQLEELVGRLHSNFPGGSPDDPTRGFLDLVRAENRRVDETIDHCVFELSRIGDFQATPAQLDTRANILNHVID